MLWETLTPPWQACMEEAWAGYCAGSLPIGAVITDAAGQILARGRNRIFETSAEGGLLCGHRLAHAEVNALVALDHSTVDPLACVLYTTTEPCPLCTGAIRMIGIGAVHYASRDSAAGSIDLLTATPYMRRRPVQVVGPQDPDLEAIIVGMHTERTWQRYDPRLQWVLDTWAETVPRGAALGNLLFQNGLLDQMRRRAVPTAPVVNALAELLPTL